MSFKHLFPTYRTRHRFVVEALATALGGRRARRILDVGAGEGEVDRLLAQYAERVDACDISEGDVAFARALNHDVANLSYSVQDVERLEFGPAEFDVVACLEVIEHVSDPRALLSEIARVLEPGGHVVFTCPSRRFPPSYDPINWALQRRGRRLPLGAYGYGHSWLVDEDELEEWFAAAGLDVLHKRRLSHGLAAASECYWPGLMQRWLKSNAENRAGASRSRLRPGARVPRLVTLTDALVDLDARLLRGSRASVGLGYLLTRR